MSSSSNVPSDELEAYMRQIEEDFEADRFEEVIDKSREMVTKFGPSSFASLHIFHSLWQIHDRSSCADEVWQTTGLVAYNAVFEEKFTEAIENDWLFHDACKEAHRKGQSELALNMLMPRLSSLEKELSKNKQVKGISLTLLEERNDSFIWKGQMGLLIKNIEDKLRMDYEKAQAQKQEEDIIKKNKKREKKEKKRERQRQQQEASIQEAEAKAAESHKTEVNDEIQKEEASVIEVSEKSIIIEIGPCALLHVRGKDNAGLYYGKIISDSTCVGDVSLIPSEDNDVFKTYNILRGAEDFNLSPHWVIDGSVIGCSKFLIVPRVFLVTLFFEGEHKKLMSLGKPVGFEGWWNHIEVLFKKIFRNVVKGMLVLFPKHFSIGSEVFVSQIENTGKLIPSPIFNIKKDVGFFLHISREIINISGENFDNINQLPKILREYFSDLRDFQWNASKSISDIQFCIDCPYFWDSKERITFLRRLNIMCKAFQLFRPISAIVCTSRNHQWALSWMELIPSGTRYARVLEYMIQKALEQGENTDHVYSNPGDIVRYIAAVFHHFNDGLKEEDWSMFMTEEQLEEDLSKMFPNLYQTLWFVVRQLREELHGVHHWDKFLSVANRATPNK